MAIGTLIRSFIALVLVAGASTLVSVWALASPKSDPVGEAVIWAGRQADDLRRWYGRKPVNAKPDWQAMRMQVAGADAGRGRDLVKLYGCGACHQIPGVPGADGTVGPSLSGLAERSYIAGILTNSPGELTRWLINPPYFAPATAMPDLGITEAEAMDMTAYLYTLGGDG